MADLTQAQRLALKMVERRNWPAGEPRIGWIPKRTAAVLLRRGLIEARIGSERPYYRDTPIADLTDAGRALLRAVSDTQGER